MKLMDRATILCYHDIQHNHDIQCNCNIQRNHDIQELAALQKVQAQQSNVAASGHVVGNSESSGSSRQLSEALPSRELPVEERGGTSQTIEQDMAGGGEAPALEQEDPSLWVPLREIQRSKSNGNQPPRLAPLTEVLQKVEVGDGMGFHDPGHTHTHTHTHTHAENAKPVHSLHVLL